MKTPDPKKMDEARDNMKVNFEIMCAERGVNPEDMPPAAAFLLGVAHGIALSKEAYSHANLSE